MKKQLIPTSQLHFPQYPMHELHSEFTYEGYGHMLPHLQLRSTTTSATQSPSKTTIIGRVIDALNLHPLTRVLRQAIKRGYRRLLGRPIYSRDTTALVARACRPKMFCSLGKPAVLIIWNPLFYILNWGIQLRLKENNFLTTLKSSVLP